MIQLQSLMRHGARLLALSSLFLLAGCERPPMESVQHGFRGTGMVQVYNPRAVEKSVEANTVPVGIPPLPADGPLPGAAPLPAAGSRALAAALAALAALAATSASCTSTCAAW